MIDFPVITTARATRRSKLVGLREKRLSAIPASAAAAQIDSADVSQKRTRNAHSLRLT